MQTESLLLTSSTGTPAASTLGTRDSSTCFPVLLRDPRPQVDSTEPISARVGGGGKHEGVEQGRRAGFREPGMKSSSGAFGSLGSAGFRIPGSGKKSGSTWLGQEDGWGVARGVNGRGVRSVETAKRGRGRGEGVKEQVDEVVKVEVENLGHNSRKIVAKIRIGAPLEVIWAVLTDYEHLADFIPGLAVSDVLEKRHNGARLYQVGEQNLALGMKFKAKAVVDCEEKPKQVHHDVVQRDIDFETVEGDFQVFKGTWRMEQQVGPTSSAPHSWEVGKGVEGAERAEGEGEEGNEEVVKEEATTLLSYILVVQPKVWMPVGLIEGRLTGEVKTNLLCIRERSLLPVLT